MQSLLKCCVYSISLIWVPLESSFHALFKNKGCCSDRRNYFYPNIANTGLGATTAKSTSIDSNRDITPYG